MPAPKRMPSSTILSAAASCAYAAAPTFLRLTLLLCVTAFCVPVLPSHRDSVAAAERAPVKETAADATADENVKEQFRAAKKEIQSRLRNKQVFERITAVRDAGKYPTADAAKLIVTIGLRDEAPEVRNAAYDSLLDLKDNSEVTRYLITTVTKETRRGAIGPGTLPMLAVLLASPLPDIERDVMSYLEKQAGSHDGLALVEALADELGGHGQTEDVAPLAKLTKLAGFEHEFGLRRAIVQALIKINNAAATGELIEILPKVKGEIRGDIVQFLTQTTGQDLGLDSAAWTQWWKDNAKTYQTAGAPAVARKEVKDFAPGRGGARGTSMYYGLSIYAHRLVFIIDISSSMLGPRLEAAKRELLQAVDGLTEDTEFSIVAFNSMVHPWQRQLVPATGAMKQAAARWINALEANSMTASYDALEAGLRFDAEALYFLTDGEPHGGKVSAPADIVTLISRANYSRRLSIYTIGIGVGAPGSIFDEFLSALAKQNWGIYRRVDQ